METKDDDGGGTSPPPTRCRLCDEKRTNMLSVFGKNASGRQILALIRDCLPIVIYRTDPLSKFICEPCDRTLNLLVEFRRDALAVAERHRERMTNGQSDGGDRVKLYLNLLEGQKTDDKCKNVKDKSTLTDPTPSPPSPPPPASNLHNGIDAPSDEPEAPPTPPPKRSPPKHRPPVVNGAVSANDAADSDMEIELLDRGRRKRRRRRPRRPVSPPSDLIAKKRRLIGPKSRVKLNPRIKITRRLSYEPFSLLKCVVHAINKRNLRDFAEKPFERVIEDVEEVINLCTYCESVFDSESALAKHELDVHIRLQLERVDVMEYWDKSERFATVRNRWLKRTLLGSDCSDDEEDEVDDEEEEEGDDEEEYDASAEYGDDLLVPMDADGFDVSRNSKIVYIDEEPTHNGVPLKNLPKYRRNEIYPSVRLNGVRRKFCNLCRYTFKDNWAIELHYMSKTCYYTCNYCGVKYNKNKLSFPRHLETHIRAGDRMCEDVFVSKSKMGAAPKRVSAKMLSPYVPTPRNQQHLQQQQQQQQNNTVKPIKMKSLLEKRKVNPTTLKIKTEPGTNAEPIQVAHPMTTLELAKTHSKAYFCKKCYQVFPKLDEYNRHSATCTGQIEDPEMNVIRPYVRKETKEQPPPTQPPQKQQPKPQQQQKPQQLVRTKIERDVEVYSSTGRPVRHCVKEVISYNDEKDVEYRPRSPSFPGRFECNFCASVFPTVHSRNSHMRIHKGAFKSVPPPKAPGNNYNIRRHVKVEPVVEQPPEPPPKRIKQEQFEPIVEIHEGHSSRTSSSSGVSSSVSITPLRKNNKLSPSIMQLVQNNPNITLKSTTTAAAPRTPPQPPKTPTPPPQCETPPDGRMYKCSSCSKPFANKSNLYFHKKNQCGGSKYPCPFCKKRFGTEASYSSHIFYSHPV